MSPSRPTRAGRYVRLAGLAVVGMIMLWWSWGTWPDVLIDFGAQLYVAWRLSIGELLYADIAYLKGPFSSFLNALWFRLFGVSLQTLVFCDLAILAGLVYVMYRILSDISDETSATVGCLTLLLLFSFGQLVGIGNYNFVCPYSYEVAHGVALSALAIFCFSRYVQRRTRWPLVGCGAASGLVLLTDLHVFLSLALAMMAAMGWALWTERAMGGNAWRLFVAWATSVASPVLIAVGFLGLRLPLTEAARAVFGGWLLALGGNVVGVKFYQTGMGLHDPVMGMAAMLIWVVRYAALFVPVGLAALMARRLPRVARALIAAGMGLVVAAWLSRGQVYWVDAFRPLPAWILGMGLAAGWIVVASRQDPRRNGRAITQLVLFLWALGLLAKMVLNARIYHYGFALAMPATLLLVVALLGWIPRAIDRMGGCGAIFQMGALAAWLVCVVAYLQMMAGWFDQKRHVVADGRDQFHADARGLAVSALLRDIERRLKPGDTLAVFPEGAMINYLAHRVNPTPYINLVPLAVALFGEEQILASLRDRPPDFIALVHKDTSEEGPRFFGRDYGQRIDAWIRAQYQEVALFGDRPLQDHRFGILLLQRTGSSHAHASAGP